jgi:uncharacterized protein YjaZ
MANVLLRDLAEEVHAKVSVLIPVAGVRFQINQRVAPIVSEVGIGGTCFRSDVVSIDAQDDFDSSVESNQKLVRYTVAHELHHAARWRSVGCGGSLGEAVVAEGLADHFAREVTPGVLMPWTRPLGQVPGWICRTYLKLALHRAYYDRRIWFFQGSRLRGIPRWAGYSLGFEVVGRYLSLTKKMASDCHATPANTVLKKCLTSR